MAKRRTSRYAPARRHRPKRKTKSVTASDAEIIDRLWRDKKLRKKLSSWFSTRKGKVWTPTEIYPRNGSFAFTKIPSSEFQQGIFRTEIVPSKKYRDPINVVFGCRAGHWDPRGDLCQPGFMDVHRIDVPRGRVAKAMGKRVAMPGMMPRAAARRAANPAFPDWPVAPSTTHSRIGPISANPLLMTVGLPPLANPGGNPWADMASIPFTPGVDIPFSEFQAWVHETQDPHLIDQLAQAEAQHKKFHGSNPDVVGFAEIALGGNAPYPPAIMAKAGMRTAESYRPHSKSNKGESVYVHEFDDEPPVLFGGERGSQFTLTPMVGSAYIDDWFRG